METVLILSAVTLNTAELLSFLGTLAGVAVAVLFGVTFVKGSLRVNLRKFFRFTTVILVFVAFQLLISGVHELSERGILPATRESMALIGPIVRNDAFFFVTILALAALMVLFEFRARQPAVPPEKAGAERRKAEWSARRERMWMSAVYASAFVFIMLVTAQFIYAKSLAQLSPATEVIAENNQLHIPLSQISDGDLHRYRHQCRRNLCAFLFDPQAGWECGRAVRCLRNLRLRWLLPNQRGRDLQELLGTD